MSFRKKTVWVVKSSTPSGADFIVISFKDRFDAVDFEIKHRDEYNNNLWIEKLEYF